MGLPVAIVIKSDRIHLILSRDNCGQADCDREVICFFLCCFNLGSQSFFVTKK